jgi:peptidoglycan/xylan/chitin deacetylase (PgdA/CDA1 family)
VSLLFDHGVFTLSLDFELAWGSRDLVDDVQPLLEASRVIRRRVFPELLRTLGELGVVATWATVGHLFLGCATPGQCGLHPGLVPPRHRWKKTPWLEGVPEGTEEAHPEFYGRSLVIQLRDAGQEIGCHSFSHPIFGDPGCSRRTAETELAHCVAAAAELDIPLRSFVYPRNSAGFVDLLARHGFTCWRGQEPVWFYRPSVPKVVGRAAHFAAVARASRPPTVLPFRDRYGLWCIPGSGSFLPYNGVLRAIPISRRVERAIAGIDSAVAERRVSHFWLHPLNLADEPTAMLGGLKRVLEHAARRRDAGRLEILPMAELAARAEAMSAPTPHLTNPSAAARSVRS